ncbi:MAG TPA: MMPL family transporter [Candidatus Acidoferrum sp.]|jgi:predicted exporter/lauroyl/myristoyl acyltransferase|nr:MMPL family transporter [Candidatus Acidoferrum sp.]
MKSPGQVPSELPQPSLKHPGRWLWFFLLIPVVFGLARLRFDAEVFDLLPGNLPAVQGLKLYQEHFANARELLITLQAADPEQAETAARDIASHLRSQTDLVAAVTWEPPWLEHPGQAAELIAYLWFNQPPELFRELAKRLAPNTLAQTLTAAREELATTLSPQEMARLSYDPFGLTRLPESTAGAAPAFGEGQEMFSSRNGKFRILFVKAAGELRTYRQCQEWLAAIRETTTRVVPKGQGISLGYTGRPAFVAEIAGGMEHDIATSVGGTAVIIACLFWLAHRRLKPMLWLLTLLALVLTSTLALGGLIFGTINVVSMGFAAILLGLAVDYAVVHYQEALAHPNLSIPQIRHAIAPSIFWAAVTTISAFLVLNFGGLPGLGQLGTLVGLGVALAATIMIFEFLPPLFPGRNHPTSPALESAGAATATAARPPVNRLARALVLGITAGVMLAVLLILAFGPPGVDTTANALRPRGSPAYTAVDEIRTNLNQGREPLWLIIDGETVPQVEESLTKVQSGLSSPEIEPFIAGFNLPAALWPRPAAQAQNRLTARALAAEREALRQVARNNGFAESALALTEEVLNTWEIAAATTDTFWPTNPMSRWIFEKFATRTPTNYFVLGLVNLKQDVSTKAPALAELEAALPKQHVLLCGWELLGTSIFSTVKDNLWKVVVPMLVLVLLSLYLAFRGPPEILLSIAALFLSAAVLLSVMRLANWSWNLLNLMALPLVLGTGVDYSIFMQLALRRHHGDLRLAHQSVGRALLLCGGTAIAGFGSLAWSSNAGMASLGQVCAIGVASNMLIAIFLLPVWWDIVRRRKARGEGRGAKNDERPGLAAGQDERPSTPSSLYRADVWRLGLRIVRIFPRGVCVRLGGLVAGIYSLAARHRREVVVENLLPALNGDRVAALKHARAVFRQFALKVIDLWRYEAGLPLDDLFGGTSGWEHFEHAQAQNRGILLVTPHLGNWEFGGPALSRRGVKLQVITLAEPGEDFTELRQASRARWHIETLVIRDDPFAFLEIIRRLEGGATVALLIDRPPAPTAVTVQLFGRPFAASVAAAELARASGCVVLPVYMPRASNSYEAHILPAVPYNRAALRDRAARQQFTQELVRTFEPVIRRYLDQWYHFVPVWPQERRQRTPCVEPGLVEVRNPESEATPL